MPNVRSRSRSLNDVQNASVSESELSAKPYKWSGDIRQPQPHQNTAGNRDHELPWSGQIW